MINNSSLNAEKNGYWGAKICNKDGLVIEDNVATHCAYRATSVTIPDYVTCIGEEAFRSCSQLKSVTIGNSVESIGKNAFIGCDYLEILKVYSEIPASVEGYLDDVDKSKCVLYVPKGTLERYMDAPVWGDFKNIVEMSGGETAAKSTLADSGIKVFGKGMNIIVKGALESAPVKVSGTDGVTLRNAIGNGAITMDTKGIYFVTVANQTFKVWL